jgi:hypothetical protein
MKKDNSFQNDEFIPLYGYPFLFYSIMGTTEAAAPFSRRGAAL